MMLFDDTGSWPASHGFARESLSQVAASRDPSYIASVQHSMEEKIGAGLEVPNYPQFQNMCEQFLSLMRNPDLCTSNPYQIREEHARIVELDALHEVAQRYHEERGERLRVRACVTGSLELYLYELGPQIDPTLLDLFSDSVNAFLRNAVIDTKHMKTQAVSIDDPSVGIVDFNVDEDALIDSWERCASGIDVDVQAHLHSPLAANIASTVSGIDVVSAETASHPEYMDIIDKRLLRAHDTFLRVGIVRSDFDRMASEYNEEHGTNVFKMPDCHTLVAGRETQDLMEKRLANAYERFGDLIRYAGPDCTLMGYGEPEVSSVLLRNARAVIDEFRRRHSL